VLRCAVGLAAMLQSVACLSANHGSDWRVWAFSVVGILAGILLITGLITPIVCLVLIVSYAGQGLEHSLPCQPTGSALTQMIVGTVSIALLGPGAFSLDARLFGRREIVIPD
jgi:uncharacterized membrane protein YphA (DoxX/SURF4 family)